MGHHSGTCADQGRTGRRSFEHWNAGKQNDDIYYKFEASAQVAQGQDTHTREVRPHLPTTHAVRDIHAMGIISQWHRAAGP